MAKRADPRKTFNFRLEIDGIDQMEVQEIKLPDLEIEKVMHGGYNRDSKTAGKISIGDVELKKIRVLATGDKWAWDWLTSAQNPTTGRGGTSAKYKRQVVLKELLPTGKTVNTWILYDCWAQKLSLDAFKREGASANIIESVTLCVEDIKLV